MTWQKWHKTKYFRFLLSNLNLLRAADYLCFKKGWWKQMKICTKIFWVRKMKMKLTRKASISLTDWRYKIDISMYLTPPLLRSQKAWCYIYFGNVLAMSEWLYSSLDTTIVSWVSWTGSGPEHVMSIVHVQPSHQWTIEHATSNVLYHIRSWSQSKLILSYWISQGKAKHV